MENDPQKYQIIHPPKPPDYLDKIRVEIERYRKHCKMVTAAFLETHGKRHEHRGYDYTFTHYKTPNEFITVVCPTHGPFRLLASAFMEGEGCPVCDGVVSLQEHLGETAELPCPPSLSPRPNEPINDGLEFLKLTTSTFSERASRVHGGVYTYELVEYVNLDTPVVVTCPTHGYFEISPGAHLRGSLCPSCALAVRNVRSKYKSDCRAREGRYESNLWFVHHACIRHHSRYTYELIPDRPYHIQYIPVTCPYHGPFAVGAREHLKGVGCPVCKELDLI